MNQARNRLLGAVATLGCILPIMAVAQVAVPTSAALPSAASPTPDIQIAIYASPRTGRSFDVTHQLQASCLATPGSCLVTCGNQLAGDPDFGTPKLCRIVYDCHGGDAQDVQLQEGEHAALSCPAASSSNYGPALGRKDQGVECSRASNAPERAICASSWLRLLDQELAQTYAKALAASGVQRSALVDSERHWIADRNDDCGAVGMVGGLAEDCLRQAYRTRLAQLSQWVEPGGSPSVISRLPRMNVGDEMSCDEIISATGILLTSNQGWGIPLSTPCSFRPPVDITIVARADPTNVRIRYAAEQVIFNWEMQPSQLRIDGGPANGLHKIGAGSIPVGQDVTIRWLVTPSSQDIYVDGELRFHHSGDYSHIDRPVSVFTAEGSTILVRSIIVHKLQ